MMQKNNYNLIVDSIIREQGEVIGPLATQQASKVEGIEIDSGKVKIVGNDPKKVLEDLVKSYAELFGRASIELSKEAVHEIPGISEDSLPEVLR